MTSLEGALQAWPSRPMRALVQIANHVQWDGWSRVTEMLHELESLEVLTQASSTQTDTTAKLRTQLRDCAASISTQLLLNGVPAIRLEVRRRVVVSSCRRRVRFRSGYTT